MTARILGLDLSLTRIGAAHIDPDGRCTVWAIKPPASTGHVRLDWLSCEIAGHCEDFTSQDLVVVEGPSYGNQGTGRQSGHHERAGLWWLVTWRLWCDDIPLAVVPPGTLKKYATGVGNAGKDAVLLATAKRFPEFNGGNDEADALWLAAMGADHLGSPVVGMPAKHREALDAVKWPEIRETS